MDGHAVVGAEGGVPLDGQAGAVGGGGGGVFHFVEEFAGKTACGGQVFRIGAVGGDAGDDVVAGHEGGGCGGAESAGFEEGFHFEQGVVVGAVAVDGHDDGGRAVGLQPAEAFDEGLRDAPGIDGEADEQGFGGGVAAGEGGTAGGEVDFLAQFAGTEGGDFAQDLPCGEGGAEVDEVESGKHRRKKCLGFWEKVPALFGRSGRGNFVPVRPSQGSREGISASECTSKVGFHPGGGAGSAGAVGDVGSGLVAGMGSRRGLK